jgi:RimJ/RimL family protein N-acetyltransferase
MKRNLRLATKEEIDMATKFINEARAYQNEQGFVQWTDAYPNRDTVCDDVKQKIGYMFTEGGKPVGYMGISFSGEPAYDQIEGAWKTGKPYAVVHRLALGKEGRNKGVSKDIFSLIKKLCIVNNIHAIRVDTDDANKLMQHVLQREGFQYCGTISFAGGPKMAYELDF